MSIAAEGGQRTLGLEAHGSTSLTLPGLGDEGPRCGEWRPGEFCDEAGHLHFGAHNCGRRSCPRCWSGQWAGPRTVSVVERLAAARYVEPAGLERRAVHVAVSPPAGIESVTDFFEARSRAVEIARDHGIRGGVTVPHGWRQTDEAERLFAEALEAGEWDPEAEGGRWRFIRQHERPWRSLVEWSPHFHVVGLARDVEGRERSDGWLVENIKRGDSHGLEPYQLHDRDGYEDMAGVVRYLLSHAAVPTEGLDSNRQAVTWFGSLHGRNFDPEEELSGGAWATIQRYAEEIVGDVDDRDDGDDQEGDDRGACEVDGCEGRRRPIFEASHFLERPDWCDHVGREAERRVAAALDWRVGRRKPPPGLKRPQDEEQAREALEAMVG